MALPANHDARNDNRKNSRTEKIASDSFLKNGSGACYAARRDAGDRCQNKIIAGCLITKESPRTIQGFRVQSKVLAG